MTSGDFQFSTRTIYILLRLSLVCSFSHLMESNGSIVPDLIPTDHSTVREDLSSPIQGLPSITRVVVYFPLDIYQLLAAALGGPPNLMNALLPSSVEVQINNGTTGMHYHGHISEILPLPAQNYFPDAIFNRRSSPWDARMASQLHETMYPPYQAPSGMRWEHATTTPGAVSSDFESVFGNVNGHATLYIHPSSPPELPSTIPPIFLPSVSSSTTVTPSITHPPFFDGGAASPEIPSADRQISHYTEYGTRSAHVHQIQQPGSPRAYMVDGLLVDEEDLTGGNTDDDRINVHACCRGDSICGLWVKADRRSIMRHGQRWHGDARGGGDRKIVCPWSGCNSEMRASDIPRHTLSTHFGVSWICRGTGCSKVFTRHDSFKAHSRRCGSLAATVNYDSSARVINTNNVL
ncbi:hypothetical protein DFH29DRAFT_171541 [Suillus ampliporus]|nr:hypothetical protein DFH29DRAFT_171541 [Suillus ampliporus]